MVDAVEQRAAVICVHDWQAANALRTNFDRELAAEPERESDARRMARKLGI